jgi:hypothetical protein
MKIFNNHEEIPKFTYDNESLLAAWEMMPEKSRNQLRESYRKNQKKGKPEVDGAQIIETNGITHENSNN